MVWVPSVSSVLTTFYKTLRNTKNMCCILIESLLTNEMRVINKIINQLKFVLKSYQINILLFKGINCNMLIKKQQSFQKRHVLLRIVLEEIKTLVLLYY